MPTTLPLADFLAQNLPSKTRTNLRTSVLPTLLHSITSIAHCLRESQSISTAGSTNTSGDAQLNVDLATNEILHASLRTCASIVAASSEEDEGENAVKHNDGVRKVTQNEEEEEEEENYAVAFDPLDGSSIIPANWSVGTIIGIWDGRTALHRRARDNQIAAILGVLGPRTTAIVAIRVPEAQEPLCFEVALGDEASIHDIHVIRPSVAFASSSSVKTRYFAPANLRAAAQDARYKALVDYFIENEYTLRYSGGLVPDVYHAFVKGHGVYVSPVTAKSKAKLRVLYEVAPIALIVECAGGRAVDSATGRDILEKEVRDVDERSGLVCGTREEVEMVVGRLRGEEA